METTGTAYPNRTVQETIESGKRGSYDGVRRNDPKIHLAAFVTLMLAPRA